MADGEQTKRLNVLGRVAMFQVPVEDVADRSGLGFGELPSTDTLRFESVGAQPLESLDQVAW